jgi:hypothetical protein
LTTGLKNKFLTTFIDKNKFWTIAKSDRLWASANNAKVKSKLFTRKSNYSKPSTAIKMAAQMTFSGSNTVQLNSTNWDYWSASIRPALKLKKCLLTITEENKPSDTTKEVWDEKCDIAAYVIKATLSEEILMRVNDIDCPFKIYKTLRESFEGSGMDKGIKLVGKLNALNFDFPGLSSIVQKLSQLKTEFTSHFDFRKDDFWVAYALHSLPPRYEQLRVALKTKDNLTLESLKTFLNQESSREDNPMLARMIKQRCERCGRGNHITSDCFAKTRPAANGKGTQRIQEPIVAPKNKDNGRKKRIAAMHLKSITKKPTKATLTVSVASVDRCGTLTRVLRITLCQAVAT